MKGLCKKLIIGLASIAFTAAITDAKPSPDECINILKKGNERFVAGKSIHPNTTAARLKQAGTENQADYALSTVITCSDSRVPVERVFDTGIMDTFVIRVAGNVCNTDEVGSIEYGLEHVKTPVLVVLGHKQCGAVTAVTNAVQGHGHPLERNIPALVAPIKPAVERAMRIHSLNDKKVIPYAIEENVWQGIEDLFMKSPATRNTVKSGKAKVVGAIYDVGTGKIEWLSESKTMEILHKVESNPNRAMNAMAGGGHATQSDDHGVKAGSHGSGSTDHAAHTEIQAVKVTLADNHTKKLLRTDWLGKDHEKLATVTEIIPHTGLFWLIVILLTVTILGSLLLGTTGQFSKTSLKVKLYLSYGALSSLGVTLAVISFIYLDRVNSMQELAKSALNLDVQTVELANMQSSYLLYGIQNTKYGDKIHADIVHHIDEFSEYSRAMRENEYIDDESSNHISELNQLVTKYKSQLTTMTNDFEQVAFNKEKLDKEAEEIEEALESLGEHHRELLTEAELAGDMKETLYQSLLVEHLSMSDIYMLKVAHGEVEFLLDKKAIRVDILEKNLGTLKGYLNALAGELRLKNEKEKLHHVQEELVVYEAQLIEVISAEAEIGEITAEMRDELHEIELLATGMSHHFELISNGMSAEANLIFTILIAIAAVVGASVAILVSRSINLPIATIISGLQAGSTQVTAASGQVSASGQSLASGASQQASSLEEISASLEEMSSMTQQNATNANQADGLAKDAQSGAEKGAHAMTRMGEAIDKIKSSSDETAKIIKTIDEIAFQTNLLALNAAVEAARAGEAGKGFAVVAEEVRNLAQRSAEAAKDTSALIEQSQSNADNGVAVSKEVAQILHQIVEVTSKVNGLITEVTVASNQQNQGIEEINSAVGQLDQVTQSNAAGAEESASAGEELSAQAADLSTMVEGLVTLIEGDSGHTEHSAPNQSTYTSLPPRSKPASSPQKINTRSKPEQMIPLNDDDMSDF